VGTGQGIGIYDNLTARFAPAWYYPYGSEPRRGRPGVRRRIDFNVTSIRTDSRGNTLIGTIGWGFLMKMPDSEAAIPIPFLKDGRVQNDFTVQAIVPDSLGHVWLFIREAGLCLFDAATRRIRVVNNTLRDASCLVLDPAGTSLWLGTSKGLYQYSIAANRFLKEYHEGATRASAKPTSTGAMASEVLGGLTSGNLACLSFDLLHRLWIGTDGGGINILDPVMGRIDYLLPGEEKNSLTSESVYSIYEDKENRKWIGTLKGGIDILDEGKSRFGTIAHNPLNSNSLINNFSSSFFEDPEGNLWIGTDGGGLSIWNRRTNRFTNYQHRPGQPASLGCNSITSIRQDRAGQIWLSTFGGGIDRFDRASGSFRHYRCINARTMEENKNVWLLYEDRSGNLWASTFGNGRFYRYNRALDRFDVFNQAFIDFIAITEDHSGALWAGNSHQLIRVDTSNRHSTVYEIGKPVRSIYEDSKGRFWIGTEGKGLLLFDRNKGQVVSQYSDADGLCNNAVLNILEDRKGHLWLSTFNGLCRFDPQPETFKNFYQGDGLQSNQFLYSAAIKLRSGELAFGGIKGFNLFYPDSIRPRSYSPPLLLTGLRIDNQPLSVDDRYITATVAGQVAAIRVPYNQAILSFDFAALEYSAPSNIAYGYFLDGWDKHWNYTKNIRTINYSNLGEGSYRLRLKSTNAEGVWSHRETTLFIVVLPPWYSSWWAWLLYGAVAMTLIYYYRQYKVRQTRLEYEIQIARLTAEKEKEVNDKRLSFFTSISHEFRTPLTLIINPLKDILKKQEIAGEEHQEVKVVYRNARRLLSLVDQLLLFRKAESEGDKLKITRLNFYDLCKNVYLAFVQKARAENIEYVFECDNRELELYADREKMEIVFYNLISNALKYTPAGEKVSLGIRESDDAVLVTIEDTGSGIPAGTGQRLFEKFFQVMEDGHPSKVGFGIGLYLVRQFVESHKGSVWYESGPGKGTTFFVKLTKGREHLDGRPVFEGSATGPAILEELAEREDRAADQPAVADVDKLLAPAPLAAASELMVPGRHTVLVVDDNEQLLEYITRIFAAGYTVYRADSGEKGLEMARNLQPDIIISDIVMNTMSGIDLCRTLKEDLSLGHIPVILLTGSPSSETRLLGVEEGADDYITKPFDKEILLARVASLLKSRNNLQKYFYNEITLQKNTGKISAEDRAFIDRCIQIVKEHLNDDDFSIKIIATGVGMSHSGLYKKIKSVSGQSVNGFIRFIRLRQVAEWLINTEKNVNEAALEAGFNDLKYFREQFHKLFGMVPSEYIKKYRPTFSKNLNVNREASKNN
jgi:signal transduction histidine kinase/ligand-binding sensor domain-containing protein/CheY-like chemotaxis protein